MGTSTLAPESAHSLVFPETFFEQNQQNRFDLEDYLRFLTGGTLDTAGPGDFDDSYTGGNVELLETPPFFSGFWDLTAFALEAEHINELRLFSGEGSDPGILFKNSDVLGDIYTPFGTFVLVNFEARGVDPHFFDNDNSSCVPEFLNAPGGGIQFWEIQEDVAADMFAYLPDKIEEQMGLKETGLKKGDIIAGFNDCFTGDADYEDMVVAMRKSDAIPLPASALIFLIGLMAMINIRKVHS
jgi:hypothetical protein